MNKEIIIYDGDENSLSTEVRHPLLSPAKAYLNTLSLRSRNTQTQALKKFIEVWGNVIEDETGHKIEYLPSIFDVNWTDLSYNHMSIIRAKLADLIQNRELTAAYCNNIMAAVKGTLKESQRMGIISRENYANIVDFKSFKVNHQRKGHLLSQDEIRALIAVCDEDENTTLGIRDAALLSVMASTGMRRQEICDLRIEDVNLATRRVQIVSGKGNKNRVVFIKNSAVKRIKAWLEIRPEFEGNTYLFLPVMRYGYIANRHMSNQTIQLLLQTRAEQAGLGTLHPHDIRKYFGTTLLKNNGDIAEVSKLLGHSNVSTTIKHYDLRGEDDLRDTADKLPDIEFDN